MRIRNRYSAHPSLQVADAGACDDVLPDEKASNFPKSSLYLSHEIGKKRRNRIFVSEERMGCCRSTSPGRKRLCRSYRCPIAIYTDRRMDTRILIEQLARESNYRLDDGIMELFLDSMTERRLRPKEVLIEFDTHNDQIYILTEGIMRSVYFDGVKERTLAFALPGTMSMSLHSYYMNRPVFLQHEACCEAAVLCSTKQNFDRFISLYPEFAQWVLNMAYCQLYFYEMKLCVIKGDARERFRSLIQNRPEILEKVPLNAIASYLGITPSYLSRLKKKLRHK